MEIYIDVLFLENLVVNYFILMLSSKISKSKSTNIQQLFGAIAGALYVVLLILLPGIKSYYSFFAKFGLSLLIVGISFTNKNIKEFIKNLLSFYLSTFVFAGAAFAIMYLNSTGGFVRNGIVYMFWKTKWWLTFLTILTIGIVGRVFWDIIRERLTKDKMLIPIRIVFDNKLVELFALVDTGNMLKDPFSKTPVVVVEFSAIKNTLPKEIQEIFINTVENDLAKVTEMISKTNWLSRFRLIPFSSLGKENGMLIGFRPDYLEIGIDKKSIKEVVIGIYNKTLSKNDNYNALLSSDLF